jgi:hypothetical protein
MHRHKHCFSHPRPTSGDCLLRHYSFDNRFAGKWNDRPRDEIYDALAADDDLLEENLIAQGIEAATAAETTEIGSVHESPVAESDAPKPPLKDAGKE